MVSVLFENPKYDANVEMIARTCDFFGAEFYTTNKQKINTALSAGVLKNKEIKVIDVRNWHGRIIATDSSFVTHPKDLLFHKDDLVVFGNESKGVSKEILDIADYKIGIKTKGIVPCLNVSAAVSAILGIISIDLD